MNLKKFVELHFLDLHEKYASILDITRKLLALEFIKILQTKIELCPTLCDAT